jgi:hypothetical protein
VVWRLALKKLLVLFPALLLGFLPVARAQVSASISGRVVDVSGAVVGGATVTVKSVETGESRTVTTDEAGNYRVLALPVGLHDVKVEKPGFQPESLPGADLKVAQEAALNFTLNVGQERGISVTVSDVIPLINTTTSSVSGMVDEREVKDLPLNGRSFDNLIALNPGAINYGLKSANTSTSNGNTFSVAGRRPADNLVLLNGIEYTGSSQLAITPGGVSGELLGIDAVREFNLLTDTYGAEYGKRSGAQVNVVTQSGTNSVHGSVFEFLRNSALDQPGIFDQGTVPPFRRNQFGGALGGPLKKDKLFLFGNYEGFRQSLALSSLSVVPDAQARLGLLPNPTTGVYAPVTNLNKAMLPYTSFWPAPNGGELTVNGLPTGTALSYNNPKSSIHEDFGTTRADYILRDGDSLSAAYTIDDGHSLIPLADPLFGSFSTLRMQVASLEETHIISPQILNTARFGFSRASYNLDSDPLATFPSSLSFVTGAGPGGIVVNGGTSTTAASGITSAGPNNAAGVYNRRNLYTFSDGVQISKGIHQISVGVWFQRMQDNENSASRQLGAATFASLTSFLQSTVSTFQVVPTANELGWRSFFGAWYVQDAMKLRPNLTVQVGLRDEFTTGWNEVSNRAANYITDSNGILETTPRVASGVFTNNNAKKLFGPRAGLAWDPFRNGKTSVRAGYGMYYSLIDDLSFLLNSLPPYNGSITSSGSLFAVTPITPGAAVPPSCGPGVPTPCTTYAPQGIQANAQTPTVQEWNLTIEQQLSQNMALRVAYVGSFGIHGLLSVDPNSIFPQICASATCTAGGTATTAANQSIVTQGQQYLPLGTRPNPYLGAGFFWFTEGNSRYNALQIDVTRRLTQGLQFRANYTFSKNLDMNSGLTGAQAQNQAQMILDRTDVSRDWGPSALNVKNQASFSASYQLPFGHGKRFLNSSSGFGEKLIGGWQLNEITTLLSGFPFTPQIGANRSGDGDTRNPDRPNINPNFTGTVLPQTQTQWFNPNAFSLPAAGTWGNLGRGVYNGPGLGDVDLSIFKNTKLTERINLQFRAELFNLFNRTNLGTPNAIVFVNNGTTAAPNYGVSPSAGLITTLATTPRQVQFGLKLMF